MKIYLLSLFSFWLFSTELVAQSYTHLSLSYSPISTYRRISYNNELLSDFVNFSDSIESPFLGGITKVEISHQFANNYRISAGLSYKKLGKTITEQYWYYRPNPENPYTIPSPNNSYTVTYIEKELYNYFSLSLLFGRYFKLSNKISLTPLIGIDLDYLLSTNNLYYDDTFEFNDLVLSGSIKVQFEYMPSERWRFHLAPIYSQSITANSTIEYIHDDRQFADLLDFQVKQYNYYYGLEFGVAYKIKERG